MIAILERMADAPFRGRTLSPDEVQRILRRAADLSASAPLSVTALDATQLEQRLKELGISDDVIRGAMHPTATTLETARDGAIRVEREIAIEGMLAPEHFEAISELIAAKMSVPGRISAVGNKLTWSPVGVALEPSVTVHAKDGHTTIRYVETLAYRGQMIIGFATLSAMAGMIAGTTSSVIGAVIAKVSGISHANGAPLALAFGVVLGVVATIGSFVGLRRAVARRAVRRSAFADALLAEVAESVRASVGASTTTTKTRVDDRAPEEAEAEVEGALETEAK